MTQKFDWVTVAANSKANKADKPDKAQKNEQKAVAKAEKAEKKAVENNFALIDATNKVKTTTETYLKQKFETKE